MCRCLCEAMRLLTLNLGFSFREFSDFLVPAHFLSGDNGLFCAEVKAVVITGGAAPHSHAVRPFLRDADLVIAADSGLDTADGYGVVPAIVVGDFDSVSDQELLSRFAPGVVRRYAQAKTESDTEIGIRIAREEGADEIVLVGGGGGRVDHLLAIAAIFEREDRPDLWVTDTSVVRSFDSELVETGTIGESISFFPLGCVPCRMISTGLRWALDGLVWRPGDVGLSNEFSQTVVRVRVVSGRLLMVRTMGSV